MEYKYYFKDIRNYISFFSHESTSVLEIGCGQGALIGTIPGMRKVGIEKDKSLIDKARTSYPEVEFIEMDAGSVKLDEKFDLVIMSNIIGQLDDVQMAFEQMRSVCHSRTKIIINYYNYLWEPILKFGEFIRIRRKTRVQHWLSRSDIRNLLYLSGFEVYRENSGMLFPIYIPLVSSFFNSFLARLPLIRGLCINNYSFARYVGDNIELSEIQKPSVSIVIPARNEAGNIENAILRMPKMTPGTEIIFVEGHSTDDTWDQIERVRNQYGHLFTIRSARQTGKGKNDAVKKGFEMATGDILMILDADLTVPPEDLIKFYNAIAYGKGDFINGCRLIYQMDKQAMRLLNLFGNKVFGMIFSWLLDQPVKDTLCGTKVMWRTDYWHLHNNRKYFGDFDPFGDFDLLFGAYKLNLKIVEMPIRYRERTYGSTNISRFTHGLLLFKMCWIGARKIKFI